MSFVEMKPPLVPAPRSDVALGEPRLRECGPGPRVLLGGFEKNTRHRSRHLRMWFPAGVPPPPPSLLTVGCPGPSPRGPCGSPCEAFSPAPGEKLLTGWGAVPRPDLACWLHAVARGPWPQPSRAGAAVPGPRGGAEHVRSGVLCRTAAPGPAAGGLGTCAALPEPGDTRGTLAPLGCRRPPQGSMSVGRRHPPPEASVLRARCPRARSPFYLSRRNTERWASGRCALYSSVRSDLRRPPGPGQALCGRAGACSVGASGGRAAGWAGLAPVAMTVGIQRGADA